MAKKTPCPQCGARNGPDARRCRVCTHLLNPDIPEAPVQERALPAHVQRQMERDIGPLPPSETFIPGEFRPEQAAPSPAWGAGADTTVGPASGDPWAGAPMPPSGGPQGGGPEGHASWDQGDPYGPGPGHHDPYGPASGAPAGPDPFIPGDEIVIDAAPRHQDAPPPPPPVADEPEHFDPDALFRDMQVQHLPPPPPPPPQPSDELTLPVVERGPDPLWSLGADALPTDATSEDIERVTREALRQERLRKRPGFLDKMFKPEDEA
jgi:hypothetical protein